MTSKILSDFHINSLLISVIPTTCQKTNKKWIEKYINGINFASHPFKPYSLMWKYQKTVYFCWWRVEENERKRKWNVFFISRGIELNVYVLLRWGASLQVISLLQQHCYWQATEEGSVLFSPSFCEYFLFESCYCLHFSGWEFPVALNHFGLILWLILLFCQLKSRGYFHMFIFPEWKKQTCGLEVPVLWLNKSIIFIPSRKLNIKWHCVEFAASWSRLHIGIHQYIPTAF